MHTTGGVPKAKYKVETYSIRVSIGRNSILVTVLALFIANSGSIFGTPNDPLSPPGVIPELGIKSKPMTVTPKTKQNDSQGNIFTLIWSKDEWKLF